MGRDEPQTIKYTVVWKEEALGNLADIWMLADDKELITRSSNRLMRFSGATPKLQVDQCKDSST